MEPEFMLKLSNTNYESGQSFAGGGEAYTASADFEVTVEGEVASGHVEILLSKVKLGELLNKLVRKEKP